MPRNFIEDVVPPERKSIRNIPIPNGRKVNLNQGATKSQSETPPTFDTEPPRHNPKTNINSNQSSVTPSLYNNPYAGRRSGLPKGLLWGSGILAILVVVIAVASFWSKVTVYVTPKQQSLPINNTLLAGKAENGIPFELIELSSEASKEVAGSGEEQVDVKASGRLVIYNNHSQESQKLIKNTRFETPDGLIYRIDESVTVPGQSIKSGETVPGSIEVVVYADEPGAKYNIGLTDFTIPGFEDDPRFDTFYGRSKTAMTGGFSGIRKKVDESVRSSSMAELESQLESELLKEAQENLPDGFVLYDNAVALEFEELPQTNDTGSTVTLNRRGTLVGAMFRKTDLASALISQATNDNSEIDLTNPNSLTFSISNESFSPRNPEFTFTISGNAELVWVFDQTKLKGDLSNKSKKDLTSVLANYGAIEKGRAVFRPFWKRSFPDDADKIELVIETAE